MLSCYIQASSDKLQPLGKYALGRATLCTACVFWDLWPCSIARLARLKDCQAESPLSQHDDLSQWIWEKQLQAGIRPETEDPIWQLAFALDCGDSTVQQLACQAVPLEEADNQGLTDADLRWLRGCQLMAESLPRLETGLGPEVLQAGCRRIAKAAHILQKSKPPKSCPHEEQGATLAPYLCLLQKCYATFHPATLERKYLATFFADITFTLDKGLHAQGQRFQECHGLWHLELPELQREVTESLSWVFAALQKALLEIAGHNLQLCCWSHCRSSRFPWQSENVHSLRQSAAAQIYCQLRNGWDGARSFRKWPLPELRLLPCLSACLRLRVSWA